MPLWRKVIEMRGPALRTFGHRVLPVVLAGAAHDEEVAMTDVVADRPPAASAAAGGTGGVIRR